jgi:hypothetical protein
LHYLKKSVIFLFGLITTFFYAGCDRQTDTGVSNGNIPPSVPSSLNVYSASDGEVIIEWIANVEPDVKGYNIYRRTEHTESIKIDFTENDFYFDNSLYYDTTYYYKITAVDIDNRESNFTPEVSAVPLNRFPPSRPLFLRINARNWPDETSIYLAWQRNYETDIAGYNIYRSTDSPFNADSNSYIGFTSGINYTDTTDLSFYIAYYYKIQAVDKGNLLSNESAEVKDFLLQVPEVIFPKDDSEVNFFDEFILKAVDVPATYRIGLQNNMFFGEIWSTEVGATIDDDTLRIAFNPPPLSLNKTYYWRVVTYSGNSSEPNSVSNLFKFTLRE